MKTAVLALVLGVGIVIGGSAQTTDWDYSAFGDSYATGYLATFGYVPRYQGYLQTDNGVTVTLVNLAQNGSTAGTLLNALLTKPTFQTALQNAEVVTWDVGGAEFTNNRTSYQRGKCGTGKDKDNQDCLRSMVSTFVANWDGVVSQILSRRSLSNTIVRTMDVYYPWAAHDMTVNTTADSNETAPAKGNDFVVLNYYLSQINAHIASSCATYGIPLALVHDAFNGTSGTEDPVAKGLIASDGQHPNDTGHELIAETFRSLGYAPLR